ncbi:hypothetical protein BN1723_013983 [Verticillium longisporum]|uniref:Uncharacterized protein n=1 Tax=Verticillium longisporum TaxID=100787 RepID=A0A0G4M000_VERLO|nr:hypothetical protein BN1723_013983 [Verticillium longisporum]
MGGRFTFSDDSHGIDQADLGGIIHCRHQGYAR